MRRALATGMLLGVTVAVYATEWLAFLWPVIALVDAGAVLVWRRNQRD
jgi:hypothetical protein